ncbi:hypothetical protein [Nocardioides baekrokdamisoli]|uniref:hypothetical protein n=1 Tax=Nocardioides baekrokdamisoli TaxID=1804624 RepID=UPI000F7671EA|nr:hypothetical protein [Nocardioides baekrokdamisoli]
MNRLLTALAATLAIGVTGCGSKASAPGPTGSAISAHAAPQTEASLRSILLEQARLARDTHPTSLFYAQPTPQRASYVLLAKGWFTGGQPKATGVVLCLTVPVGTTSPSSVVVGEADLCAHDIGPFVRLAGVPQPHDPVDELRAVVLEAAAECRATHPTGMAYRRTTLGVAQRLFGRSSVDPPPTTPKYLLVAHGTFRCPWGGTLYQPFATGDVLLIAVDVHKPFVKPWPEELPPTSAVTSIIGPMTSLE